MVLTEKSVVFGDEHSIDIVFFQEKTLFHVLNSERTISAAAFLNFNEINFGQTVRGIYLPRIYNDTLTSTHRVLR